jgi:hypothetical protein
MPYEKKTASRLKEFMSLVRNNGTTTAIDNAFRNLKYDPASVRYDVHIALENEMIAEAKQLGIAWERAEFIPTFDDERQALLTDLERLRPIGRILMLLSHIRGNQAQPWTQAFAEEYSTLSADERRDAEKLAECCIAVLNKVDEPPPSVRKPRHARKRKPALSAEAAAHFTALGRQQRLNNMAASPKVRVTRPQL